MSDVVGQNMNDLDIEFPIKVQYEGKDQPVIVFDPEDILEGSAFKVLETKVSLYDDQDQQQRFMTDTEMLAEIKSELRGVHSGMFRWDTRLTKDRAIKFCEAQIEYLETVIADEAGFEARLRLWTNVMIAFPELSVQVTPAAA